MNRVLIYEKFGRRCAYCGMPLNSGWHVDHKHPKHRGGTNDMENLMPACARCNRWKATFTIDEFRNEIAAQVGRLARDSGSFRLMHDFAIITFTNGPVLFHFERVQQGAALPEAERKTA